MAAECPQWFRRESHVMACEYRDDLPNLITSKFTPSYVTVYDQELTLSSYGAGISEIAFPSVLQVTDFNGRH